mgnify:FL=1
MKALFAPAILLLNRLRFPVKFALLGLIALLVVGALLFQLAMSLRESIVYAEKELEASERLPRVLKVIQLLQQHRGLSSGVLSGNEAMRPLLSRNKNSQGGFHAAVPMGLIWNPSVAARRFSAAMLRSRCCSS